MILDLVKDVIDDLVRKKVLSEEKATLLLLYAVGLLGLVFITILVLVFV